MQLVVRLHAYPVLFERPGDMVAHFKCTVLVLPSGTVNITDLPYLRDSAQSDRVVDPDIGAILSISVKVSTNFLRSELNFAEEEEEKSQER